MSLRVLFIGNSYTFYNEMPAQVEALARELGDELTESRVVSGGATLKLHFQQNVAQERILEGGFTHVVVQEKSTGSLHDREDFDEYGARFADLARASGAVPLLYLTWARAEGHEVYRSGWSGGSPTAMLEKLSAAYAALGDRTGAAVVPVGPIWMHAQKAGPPSPLHDLDLHHASPLGGHLSALVFARVLTGEPVERAAYHPDGVTKEAATFCRTVVDDYFAHALPGL